MAKPTLALIPASQGSKLFSVLPSSGVGDFDFSRGSAATRINSQGLIENVASGQSRLDYPLIDGVVNGCPSVLLEPQRTNLVTYSEDFSNPNWTKTVSNITSNAIISPDGSLNADKLIPSASNNIHKIGREVGSVTGDYTLSIFAKKGEYKNILLWDDNLSEGIGVNLDDLSVFRNVGNEGYKIENYGNGWVRISLILNYSAQAIRYAIYVYNNSNEITFTGNGTDGLYIWGAMAEEGSYPTSYIKSNSGSATTRSAETATGAGDATTFNDSEGVLMAEMSNIANDGTFKFISLSDGTLDNVVWIYYRSDNNAINFRVLSSGSSSFDQIYVTENSTNFNKLALKYKENDFSAWVNGFEVLTNSSGLTFSSETLNTIDFSRSDGTNNFYGKAKQVQYYNTALTDSELEQLTSWISFTDMANGQLYTIE